ncbi:hypothetical protein [Kitasatospora sp. NPDC017646]
MDRETIAFAATIIGAVASSIGAVATIWGAWHARESNKRRGKHRH